MVYEQSYWFMNHRITWVLLLLTGRLQNARQNFSSVEQRWLPLANRNGTRSSPSLVESLLFTRLRTDGHSMVRRVPGFSRSKRSKKYH